jgi:hypothetical protein
VSLELALTSAAAGVNHPATALRRQRDGTHSVIPEYRNTDNRSA